MSSASSRALDRDRTSRPDPRRRPMRQSRSSRSTSASTSISAASGSRRTCLASLASWNLADRGLRSSASIRSTTRFPFRMLHVADAVGQQTVGQLEQPLEQFWSGRRLLGRRRRSSRAGNKVQPFEMAAEAQEPPAVVAGHVRHFKPADRHQRNQGVVDQLERGVQIERGRVAREQLQQPVEDAPVVGRQAVAHSARRPGLSVRR